jgi:DNA mismatch repair ATPase MutS
LTEISARQSLVALFHSRVHLRDDLAQLLHGNGDLTRIVQKFSLGRGDPSDLATISSTITAWKAFKDRVTLEKTMEAKERKEFNAADWAGLDVLLGRVDVVDELSSRIKTALLPEKDAIENNEDEVNEEASPSDNVNDVDPNGEFRWQTGQRFAIHPK